VTSRNARLVEVSALLLRRTDFGDSDLVLLVFTDLIGIVSVLARGARKSQRRFAGGIEPFHQLSMLLAEPASGDLYGLREARIMLPRLNLVSNLSAMNTAARALAWLRQCLAIAAPEPEVFANVNALLEALNDNSQDKAQVADARLCYFGLRLLCHLGWALELEHCVRCGRACPSQSASTLDPSRGGLICRNCGGARVRLTAELRLRMYRAAQGDTSALGGDDAAYALGIIEQALHYHSGFESKA
jgi:DNA repair protein RecO (recombination protein O)